MSSFEIVQLALRILIAVAFIGMGINHFNPRAARAMAAMIPPRMKRGGILSGKNLVRITGVCELAGGVGLLVPHVSVIAGILLCVFLVAVFPANAYASTRPETFGRLAIPFWPRLFAQLVLIAAIIIAIV